MGALKSPIENRTYHVLELFSLAVGLALRDISLATSNKTHRDLPIWVLNSPLGQRHNQRILKLCPPKIVEKPDSHNLTGYVPV
jgi:hypothetical protein